VDNIGDVLHGMRRKELCFPQKKEAQGKKLWITERKNPVFVYRSRQMGNTAYCRKAGGEREIEKRL
jgi:hypothetical protein